MPEEVIIILYLHTSIDCEIDIDLTSIFGKTLKFKVKQYYNETKIKNINKITTEITVTLTDTNSSLVLVLCDNLL